MLTSFARAGCSSRVAMQLLVNGAVLPIAQMGPDFLPLDKPADYPHGEATIVRAWLTPATGTPATCSER